MRSRPELAGLVVIASVVTAMAAPAWVPADGTIFPPEKAASLTHQCSRQVPTGITGVWLPQAEQIADLERRLPEVLDKEIHRTDLHGPRMPDYLRQYGGLVVGGRKIIYVNGFSADEMNPGDGLVRKTDWHSGAIFVCDGYINYFGAEYDPQTRDFAHVVFNGIG
jgi:hypothetical protein